MIVSFKHKGLERFYRSGSLAGVQATHARRLQLIPTNLDSAVQSSDMNLSGLRLHELKGDMNGVWSVVVNGN